MPGERLFMPFEWNLCIFSMPLYFEQFQLLRQDISIIEASIAC